MKNYTTYILLICSLLISCSTKKVQNKIANNEIDTISMNSDQIIFSAQLNFKTDYIETLEEEIISAFDEEPRKLWVRDNRISCQIQISKFGYNFLTYLSDEFINDSQIRNRAEIYNGVLVKRSEYWKRVDDVPTCFPEPIDPNLVKEYANYLVDKLQNTDESKYVWQVWSEFHHLEDNYNGKYCRFTTYNTNPTYPEYDETKKDHCLVSTVNGGEIVEWIKLTDKQIIKGDRIELEARKIYLDKVMSETSKEIIKLCELAIKYNLTINKVNDV